MKFSGELSLHEGWRFKTTLAQGVEKPSFHDTDFEPVTLPHDWQIHNPRDPHMEQGYSQGYYPRNQMGWYRRALQVPEAWQGKQLLLHIPGCQRFYDVYLDGERIGGRRYGYLPLMLDLTDRAGVGEHLLAIRVNNTDTLGDRWYSGAGLCRGMSLMVKEPVYMQPWSLKADYTLREDSADLKAEITLCHPAHAGTLTVRAALQAPDGSLACEAEKTIAAEGCETRVALPMQVAKPLRWDIDHPHRYRLTLTVAQDGAVLDTAWETVGFRSFSFDEDQGFILNGRMRKLYGADLHHDGGVCFGAAVPRAVWRRRLLTLKEMGCNAIRCSHNPQDEALYDLCDELGMVMIDELYDKWCDSALYFDRLFREDWRDDLHMMVARDRNHPSIVLWSMGNELEIQYQEQFYDLLKTLCDECRRLDPSRPVSLALIGFCLQDYGDSTPLQKKVDAVLRYADIVDVFMGNYMESYYTALREAGMRKAIIGSEVFTYYRTAELSATHAIAQSPWADVQNRPYVAGGLVWAGVDYLGESLGWPCKGWTGCPVDSAGFRKLRGWYIASQWTEEPVLRLGILDGTAYDDHARANWGFPQMLDCWTGPREDLMRHVCVMTNCDEVRIYRNDESVRRLTERLPDGMMHFSIPYAPGTLRAEGWRNGAKVAEQVLHTPDAPAAIALRCDDLNEPDNEGVCHVELTLTDGFGQPWTLTGPECTIEVKGAELLGFDNGDLLADRDPHSPVCPFHLGHAVAYLRQRANTLRVSAVCGEIRAELELHACIGAGNGRQ